MSSEEAGKTENLSDVTAEPAATAAPPDTDASSEDVTESRRRFITKAGKTLAYAAPVVLLFKPKEAIAASGGGSAATPG